MDKTLIGVVGAAAASALAVALPARSANMPFPAAPLAPAQSFAELLDPIPDAVSRLKTQHGDGQPSGLAEEEGLVQLAQYRYYHHHHHHHHHYWHHHYWRPWRHHHHHHHHYHYHHDY